MNAELRASLRNAETDHVLARHGYEPLAPPDPGLAGLCTHLEDLWQQSGDCWRMLRMLDVGVENGAQPFSPEDLDFTHIAHLATGNLAPHVAAARVLTLSRAQIASLPELEPTEILQTLTTERLPWEVTWIEVNARPIECPALVKVQVSSGEEAAGHFIGALCRQLSDGIEVSPVFVLGEGSELCCPLAGQFRSSFAEQGEPGTAQCAPDAGGGYGWRGVTGPHHNLARAQEMVLMAAGDIAAALMVLSAVNVEMRPRELAGKRLKKWKRDRHPLPHVVKVRPRPGDRGAPAGAGGAGELVGSHMVRGHWMHFTKGPIFDAHPEARRWIPGLEREAVRIWRGGHVRGPQDAPAVPTVVDLR